MESIAVPFVLMKMTNTRNIVILIVCNSVKYWMRRVTLREFFNDGLNVVVNIFGCFNLCVLCHDRIGEYVKKKKKRKRTKAPVKRKGEMTTYHLSKL